MIKESVLESEGCTRRIILYLKISFEGKLSPNQYFDIIFKSKSILNHSQMSNPAKSLHLNSNHKL